MNNKINTKAQQRLIPSESTSEWFYIVLVCMLWASGLVDFVLVAADKFLGTGEIIRTVVRVLVYIVFVIGSLSYFSSKIKPVDWGLVVLFLLLFFFAPGVKFVPRIEYEMYTRNFLWALPFYLVGVSLDFGKVKKLFHILALIDIVVSSYYNLVFINAADYSGSIEFAQDNMHASYGFVLPVIYMIWYTFENFRIKSIMSWVDTASVLLGVFSMAMLGTRGSIICVFIFLVLYLFLFKLKKHKILYGILFFVIGCVVFVFANNIFMFLGDLAIDLGFSDRIFISFLSEENLLEEGSSGRDAFYPVLFAVLGKSPIWGYGLFGSYEFIDTYPHNIFMEIIFSFGYFFGGIVLLYGANSIMKAFKNKITEDERGFLFVLMGGGILGLLFSSMFIISSSFFFFVGYCFQVAYRK